MKKIICFAAAAGLCLVASNASAVDVKFSGEYLFQFSQYQGSSFNKQKYDRETQRVRIGADFRVSEALSGYFETHSKWEWGVDDNDIVNGKGGLGNHPNLHLRQAYVDWLIPGTSVKVRIGRQLQALPVLALGKNPVFWKSDPADGIAIDGAVTDWLSLSAWWQRYDRKGGFETSHTSKTADVFALIANLKFDGFRFQPFIGFAAQDNNTLGTTYNTGNSTLTPGVNFTFANNPKGYSNNTFWIGSTASMTLFDPLTVKTDFIYGDRNFRSSTDLPSQHGWFLDGSVAYKTAYGTPALFAWYGSGDDDGVKYAYQNNMPSLLGRFAASNAFFNGQGVMDNNGPNNHTGMGTWGLKLAMTNISFLKDVTHDIAVVYAQGTNDNANAKFGKQAWRYMTTKDSMVEFDFNTKYKMYKNLTFWLQLAYVVENFETHHGTGAYSKRPESYENFWKGIVQVAYTF